jgi:hypothetical protein
MKEPQFDVKEEAQALRKAIAEVNKHVARLAWMGYDVNIDYHTTTHIGIPAEVKTYFVDKIWKEEKL